MKLGSFVVSARDIAAIREHRASSRLEGVAKRSRRNSSGNPFSPAPVILAPRTDPRSRDTSGAPHFPIGLILVRPRSHLRAPITSAAECASVCQDAQLFTIRTATPPGVGL
jgi:hypothetical protein